MLPQLWSDCSQAAATSTINAVAAGKAIICAAGAGADLPEQQAPGGDRRQGDGHRPPQQVAAFIAQPSTPARSAAPAEQRRRRQRNRHRRDPPAVAVEWLALRGHGRATARSLRATRLPAAAGSCGQARAWNPATAAPAAIAAPSRAFQPSSFSSARPSITAPPTAASLSHTGDSASHTACRLASEANSRKPEPGASPPARPHRLPAAAAGRGRRPTAAPSRRRAARDRSSFPARSPATVRCAMPSTAPPRARFGSAIPADRQGEERQLPAVMVDPQRREHADRRIGAEQADDRQRPGLVARPAASSSAPARTSAAAGAAAVPAPPRSAPHRRRRPAASSAG